MHPGICYIVGAGEVVPRGLFPRKGDLVLAADGGLQALERLGVRAHALVGDIDSLGAVPAGIPALRFPVRKDDTDLSLAIRLGMQQGFRRFHLYGVAGGPRTDHFLAATQLMGGHSAKGLSLRMVARRFTLDTLTDGCILLPAFKGGTVSVFSLSPVSRGVSLRGLDYEANALTLTSHFPLGISNRAVSGRIAVGVRHGTLLIYRQIR